MKFCNDCNNILLKQTKDYILKFHCNACNKYFDSEPVDTLMKSVYLKKEQSLKKYETYLKIIAKDDHISMNVYKDCKKCKNNIAKEISINDNGNNYHFYICTICNLPIQ